MCLIDQYIPEIKELCMSYNVQRLSAFGSVLTDRFTDQSDVDLLVTFNKNMVGDYFTNFFDFKYALENVLKRDVDLVEEQYISNPYFKESINANNRAIYG